MPIYRLDGTADANLTSNAVVQVSWSLRGPGAAVRIEALVDGQPSSQVVRPRPDLLVVPPNPQQVTLRVVPAGSAVFPTPTEIEMHLIVGDSRSPDPQVVRLSPKNIAGLPFRDLVVIRQTGMFTTISAQDLPADLPMSPLADRARATARTVMGVDRLPASDIRSVVLAVDTSASMLPMLRNGSVAAVMDVVAGIAQVIGRDGRVHACGVGAEVTWLPDVPAGELAAVGSRELERSELSSGFRSTAVPEPPDPDRSLTFLISDGVPADLRDHPADRQLHLVALLPARAWSILGRPDLPASVLEPVAVGENLADRLLRRPEQLTELVTSALALVTNGHRR